MKIIVITDENEKDPRVAALLDALGALGITVSDDTLWILRDALVADNEDPFIVKRIDMDPLSKKHDADLMAGHWPLGEQKDSPDEEQVWLGVVGPIPTNLIEGKFPETEQNSKRGYFVTQEGSDVEPPLGSSAGQKPGESFLDQLGRNQLNWRRKLAALDEEAEESLDKKDSEGDRFTGPWTNEDIDN